MQIVSDGINATKKIASKLAHNLRGGETIELVSDIGGGKTTFVKALVAALGSSDHVASPSFMISKEYKTKKFRIVHFDFYRLSDAGDISHSLYEAAMDNTTVSLVEWPALVIDALPAERLVIKIDKDALNETRRVFLLRAHHKVSYCLKGLV